jgi:hypothetical protein
LLRDLSPRWREQPPDAIIACRRGGGQIKGDRYEKCDAAAAKGTQVQKLAERLIAGDKAPRHGFPPAYVVLGNRRERVRQYGNAVTHPPPKSSSPPWSKPSLARYWSLPPDMSGRLHRLRPSNSR